MICAKSWNPIYLIVLAKKDFSLVVPSPMRSLIELITLLLPFLASNRKKQLSGY